MSHWTQEDILAWKVKTFGPYRDSFITITRAIEESAEILKHVRQKEWQEVVIECADVVICLADLAEYLDVDIVEPKYRFGKIKDTEPRWVAIQINKQMALLLEDASDSFADDQWTLMQREDLAVSLMDIRGNLEYLCEMIFINNGTRSNLGIIIDTKMDKNFKRKWDIDERGWGYHVKEENQ